jgi:hypothetical protein
MPRNSQSTSSSSQRRRGSSGGRTTSGQQRSRSRNDRGRSGNDRGFAALSADERRSIAARGGESSQGRGQSRNRDENQSWRPDYDDRGYHGQGRGDSYDQGRGDPQRRPRDDYDSGRESYRGGGQGFAAMDPERRRELASRGGRASHGGSQFRGEDYRESQANRGFSGEYRGGPGWLNDDYDRSFSGRSGQDDYDRQRAEGRSWSGADEYRGSGRSQPGDSRYAGDDFFDRRGYQSHENEYRGGYNEDYRASGRSQRDYDEDEYDEGSRGFSRRDYDDEESRFSGRGRRSSGR